VQPQSAHFADSPQTFLESVWVDISCSESDLGQRQADACADAGHEDASPHDEFQAHASLD